MFRMNLQPYMHPYYTEPRRNAPMDPKNIHYRITNIEKQLDMLIKMVEYNNQMLRSMNHNNINTTAGSGGGAIIVRM